MDLKEPKCDDVNWIHLDQDKARVAGHCGQGNSSFEVYRILEIP
jgi:hypothetical protein